MTPIKRVVLKRLALAALAACVVTPGAATAQNYPSRPITVVMPFAGGSGSDVAARIVFAQMALSYPNGRLMPGLAAFFYIRTLGAMGGRAAPALPTLKSGIRTTVDPGRMFGNVEIGAAPPVESVRKAAIDAIENDSPMSCSLDDTY